MNKSESIAGERTIGVSTRLDDVLKSPSDKREYRAFTLANQLTVIVVSDPKTDKSAAALDVMTGWLKDPEELPGLAHYLEHMLFLGTEKYPVENAYAKYLAENAGSSNAYTCGDNTCYYFDCSPDALEGAIDRFAQFFISPLFTESGSEREVNAVNSEHEGSIPDDTRRQDAIHSFLSKKGHPYSSFGCGNKYSLWTRPQERGIDVRSRLIRFHQENYSANLMKLAIIGKESCDELQALVERYFLDIKNNNYQVQSWPESPFGPDEIQTRIDYLPIKDIRNLEIICPIPDDSELYKCGASSYVSSLIGHEGKGSLLSLLKKRNWVTELNSSIDQPGRGFAFMDIQIELTPSGLDNVDEVLLHFFQYIQLLKQVGPQQWYWDERRKTRDTAFRFRQDQPADHVVVELADQMTRCPVADVFPALCRVLTDYRPDLISDIVNHINPDNVRIIVSTQNNKEVVNETEQYYGAKYRYSKISPDIINKWRTCGSHEDLHLPEPNGFIPTDFELKCRDKEKGIIPRIILDDELSRVWFLQDNEYLLPRGVLQVSILSPLPALTPRNYNLLYLLQDILEDLIAEDCYSAVLAGLNPSYDASFDGLNVGAFGYNDKLDELLCFLMKFLVDFDSVGPRFEAIKEAFIRDLQNWKDEEPMTHASAYMHSLSFNHTFSNAQRLEAVGELTPDNIVKFAKDLCASVKLQYYIVGNYTEEEALGIHAKSIEYFHKISSQPLFSAQLAPRRLLKLPSDTSYLYTAQHTTNAESCICMRLQMEMSEICTRTIMLLIDHILAEPSFDVLRTKEQLGYSVWCSYRRRLGVMSFDTIIQGMKHPEYLESRIESFLTQMMTTLNDMKDDEFQKYVQSLRVIVAEKPKTLNARFNILSSEIASRVYEFDAEEKILQELNAVTLDDVKNYFQKWITPQSTNRKKLTVHVVSVAKGGAGITDTVDTSFEKPINQVITDIDAWKREHGYFPAPAGCSNIPTWKTRTSKLYSLKL